MDKGIKVFITGGTFDKEYNELNGSLYFKETHLFEMLDDFFSYCKILSRHHWHLNIPKHRKKHSYNLL